MELKFYKKATRPTGLTEGSIWFNPTTKRIELATGSTTSDTYGSDIQDATYANNVLTITKIDGSSLEIDLSNYASSSDISSLENSLASKLNKIKVNNWIVDSTELNFVGGGGTAVTNSNGTITISTVEVPTAFDASAITSGTIDIERLPKGALERLFIAETESEAMSVDCQEGDTVQVTGNDNKMYFCVNESATSFSTKFHEYTAGTATSVPWSGVTGKPSIEEGAQKNVQSDWNETDTSSDSYIQNKPSIGKVYRLYADFEITLNPQSATSRINSSTYTKLRNVIQAILSGNTNDSIIVVETIDDQVVRSGGAINWELGESYIRGVCPLLWSQTSVVNYTTYTTMSTVQISIMSSGDVSVVNVSSAPQAYDITGLIGRIERPLLSLDKTISEEQYNGFCDAVDEGKMIISVDAVWHLDSDSNDNNGRCFGLDTFLYGGPGGVSPCVYSVDIAKASDGTYHVVSNGGDRTRLAYERSIPTHTSDLTNDSGYVKEKTVVKTYEEYIGYGTDAFSSVAYITLAADEFHIVGRCNGVDITLPEGANNMDGKEYCCQFYVGIDSFTLTLPVSVYWQNGEAPEFQTNTCCQLVIVNNCAVIGAFKASE